MNGTPDQPKRILFSRRVDVNYIQHMYTTVDVIAKRKKGMQKF